MNNTTTYTASELNLQLDGFLMSTTSREGQYKFVMGLGRCYPATVTQAKTWVRMGCKLDVLNADDVQKIEAVMNRHGFAGQYRYTKSGHWVRLQNNTDLVKAIRAEFSI